MPRLIAFVALLSILVVVEARGDGRLFGQELGDRAFQPARDATQDGDGRDRLAHLDLVDGAGRDAAALGELLQGEAALVAPVAQALGQPVQTDFGLHAGALHPGGAPLPDAAVHFKVDITPIQ